MAQISKSDANAILKEMIAADPHAVAAYEDNPAMALAKKVKYTGNKYHWEIEYGEGANRSRTASDALAKANKLDKVRFEVESHEVFDAKDVSLKALREVASPNAFIDLLENILENLNRSLGNGLGEDLFLDAGAAIGQVGSVSGTSLFLKNPSHVTRFYKGQTLRSSEADGNSGSLQTGSATITGINRDTGELITGSNWTTQISALDADDFLFPLGNFGAGRQGLPAWVPITAPGATPFNNVDRTVDIVRLAGSRQSVSAGTDIASAIRAIVSRVKREGGKPDTVLCGTDFIAEFEDQLDSKVQYEELRGNDVMVGVPSIKFTSAGLKLNFVDDRSCADDVLWVGKRSTLEVIHSSQGLVEIVDDDGAVLSRNASDFGFDIRGLTIANYAVRQPHHWGVLSFTSA